MKALWTKRFEFSASFERGGKIYGHNYTLGLTLPHTDNLDEDAVVRMVESLVIQKVHSRDLSLHVDFLKGVEINDAHLLKAFRQILGPVLPAAIESLWLERDSRTRVELRREEA